jgi:hypothetical protein
MKINLKRSSAMCGVVLLAACGNNASNNSSNDATANAGPPVSLTGSPLGNAPSNTAQSAGAYTPLVNWLQVLESTSMLLKHSSNQHFTSYMIAKISGVF